MHILITPFSLGRCYILSTKFSIRCINCHRIYSTLIYTNKLGKMETILNGKTNVHRSITIESVNNICKDVSDFECKLDSSLKKWREDNMRGVWFKVAVPHVDWIPILVKKGFKIHYARDEEIVLSLWLPEKEPNKLPHYAHYILGAGAVVINDKQQILVVRERYRSIPFWKLPGGHVDKGEDIGEAAIREVLEETSVKTEFMSVLTMRRSPGATFPDCSDLYVVVRLRPLTSEIVVDDEIEDCKWMDIDEYLNHPEVHENNRLFVRQALQNEKDGIVMKRQSDIHPVTKVPQLIYTLHKIDQDGK